MKTTLKKFTATTLAVLTAVFTLCFTSFAAEADKGAELSMDGKTYYYTSISEAWSALAASDTDATIKLLEDWVAGEDGKMGTGAGFENGSMFLYERRSKAVIDLNGHTIDRGLKERSADGHVFLFDDCNSILVKDSSEEKTGTITGGNNYSYAGAIDVRGSEIKIENITIKNNKTSGRGGALYINNGTYDTRARHAYVTIDNCVITGNEAYSGGAIYMEVSQKLYLYDTTITGNYANRDAGIHTEVLILDICEITLGGKMIIADNITETDGEGLMLDESTFRKIYVRYNKNRPLSKESRITVLSKTDDNTLRITGDSSEHYFECYEYENDSYKIVKKGSGDDKYLDIKKA